ncbi:hypothetical protein Tco_1359513 [Tanacetum coccineum]
MHPTGRTLGDQNDLTTETNSDTPIVQSMTLNVKPNSYAKAAGASNVNQPKDHANFRPIVAEEVFDGVNISIPHKVVEKVSVRFENTLYGYFIVLSRKLPVEYEWKPPRCHTCNIFGHMGDSCPKKVVVTPVVNDTNDTNDGFQKVVNKKHNNKGKSAGNIIPRGFPVRIGFQVGKDFGFKPRAPNDQASSKVDSGKIKLANIATPNPFTTLDEEEDEEEDVKNIYDESKNLNIKNTGANNYYIDRRELWNNLVGHAGLMRNRPWVLLGDFNAALNLEDHSDGGYEPNAAMHEFKECVQAMEVSDVNCTGLHFTWNQKPKGSNGILKKIDRIMGNLKFSDDFLRSFAIFQPYRISDHSPCVLRIPKVTKPKPKPFKFSNFLVYKEGFREVVESGDSNTAYLPKIVKSKCARNRIEMVRDASNIIYEGNTVAGTFISHYENFLGIEGSSTPLTNQNLFSHVLDNHKAESMVREVTDNEIKEAIFSMRDDKAPGPDGFTSAFFKKAWDVIIGNSIKGNMDDIVSINQSAFVQGRRISDNILLTQELMRNYHRRRGPPRCAFKVDIQKAYDTVDWTFLKSILIGFGFHQKMVDWIMTCVTTTTYSVCVNGDLHGWFRGKRGLRQGDPLSPYLFIMDIEILTLILQKNVFESEVFQYHHLCDKQKIINLCFADDLFLFARGHPSFVDVIMQGLEEFKNVFGLVPSIPKSTTFFCNVPNALKTTILNSMPFAKGSLPIRYLGVPLISSRLLYRDCKILVEKLKSHRIIHDLEQLMRGFLWCQCELKKGRAKVAWDSWHDLYPIRDMLTIRNITRSGFGLADSVSDCISNGHWRWPPDWLDRIPGLSSIPVPNLIVGYDDVRLWCDSQGNLKPFSVAYAWDYVRLRADVVDWCGLRFVVSLVWIKSPRFANISAYLIPSSKGTSVVSIISRLLLGAVSYYIWSERNSRLFKKKVFTVPQIVQVITSMVRLKLVTFKFKKVSTWFCLLLDQWKIPSCCLVHEESSG